MSDANANGAPSWAQYLWDQSYGESAGAAPPETQTAGFDPADHTVDEVNAYLEQHPEDRDRVVALEESGKARVGVLGGS